MEIWTRTATFHIVDTLAVPGAGLRHLDLPVEANMPFEAAFTGSSSSAPLSSTSPSGSVPSVHIHTPSEPPRVRVYGSEREM
jgi:hypothetical protein